jgi:hypothetical protein
LEFQETTQVRLIGKKKENIAESTLYLMEVLEVSWNKVDTEPAGDKTFFCGNGNSKYKLENGTFMCLGIM